MWLTRCCWPQVAAAILVLSLLAACGATAGNVTFVVNPSPLVHRFGVEGNGVGARSGDVGVGRTQRYTLKDLAPGDYLIVCDFLGHRQAGMVAHLIVR